MSGLLLGSALTVAALAMPRLAAAAPVTATVDGVITSATFLDANAVYATNEGLVGQTIAVTYSYDPAGGTYGSISLTSDGISAFSAGSVLVYGLFDGTLAGVLNNTLQNTSVTSASTVTANGTSGQFDVISGLDTAAQTSVKLQLTSTDRWVAGDVSTGLGTDFAPQDIQTINFTDGAYALSLTFEVPEPTSLAILGVALLGLGLSARRRST